MRAPGSVSKILAAAGAVLVVGVLAGCSGAPEASGRAHTDRARHVAGSRTPSQGATTARLAPRPVPPRFRDPLPGMPPVLHHDVYAADGPGMFSPVVRHDPALVYVPDSSPYGHTVTVISQKTLKVVRTIPAGHLSQHVVPSYNLRHLYVNSSESNELVELNPATGRRVRAIPVPRPYNLYFTPDGKQAVVMVEEDDVIRFSNPRTFRKIKDVSSPACRGPNHADFSANGRFMVVTCEFSGTLLKVATRSHRVLGKISWGPMSMPQDVRLSPDGTTFYVADMGTDEVRLVSARSFRQVGRIKTPADPHGLYPSRDGTVMYVSDRGAGKVSVISFAKRKIVDTWTIPGGGSPDMGGVSANGKRLWLSGRYDSVVYVFDTRTGRLIKKIPVPGSPHGLCVWPQPGRYSLGHTGNMR